MKANLVLSRVFIEFVARCLRSSSGSVAVEFAFVFPILIMMVLGVAEFSHRSWATSESSNVSSSFADVVSRWEDINIGQLSSLTNSLEYLVSGAYRSNGMRVDVSSVLACDCVPSAVGICYTTLWSRSYSLSAISGTSTAGSFTRGSHTENRPFSFRRAVNGSRNIASFYAEANQTLIVVETELNYPGMLSIFPAPISGAFYSYAIYMPRLSDRVILSGAAHSKRRC